MLLLGLTTLPAWGRQAIEEEVKGEPPSKDLKLKRTPVRVNSTAQESKLIHHVSPIYPELALKARVSGLILLQATTDEKGNVIDVKVLRGHPLLNQSAITAVSQWTYSPTLLEGKPVPVVATVTVNFVVRQQDFGSRLMRAAEEGNTATVRVLLELGADVNAKDDDGRTSLMGAAQKGHTAAVRALLDAGADANAKDDDGQTSMMLAAQKGHTQIMQMLKKAGARE
jgi:TonB family protein